MDMKKAFKVWAGFSLLLFFIAAVTNWSNHPHLISFLQNYSLFFLIPVMILGWLLRSRVFKLPNDWVDHFSLSFLFGFLAKQGHFKVHSYNEATRVMWIAAILASLYLAIILGWEYWGIKLKKGGFLSKIPVPVYLWLFAVLCVGLGLWKGWEGRYVMAVLGLSPLARYYFARKDPEALKAFALLLGTDVIYGDWPPVNDLKGEGWKAVLALHHLLLSGIVFVFWEKLKDPKILKGQIALLVFAVLPMLPYFYLGYGNWTWPFQVVILGVIWGWDPWLKPYKMKVPFGLASLAALYGFYQTSESFELVIAILVFTILTSQARFYFLKLPQDFIKGLFLYVVAAFFFYQYGPDSGTVATHGPWFLTAHFCLSGLFHLFWEKIKEHKYRNAKAWIIIYSAAPIPFTLYFHSGIWLFQTVILWLAWAYDSFGSSKMVQGKIPNFSDKLEILLEKPFFKKLSNFVLKKGEASGEGLSKLAKQPKVRKAVLVLLVLGSVWIVFNVLYNTFTTHIVSFTPRGMLTSPNTVIRAKFSGDVSVSGSLDSAFQIDPPLPGSTRLEDSTTLVFTPAAALKPATTYRVRLDTGGLKSKQLFLQGSAKSVFNTEPLKVVSSRLFYTYDMVKGTEKELVGELEFNYPMDMNQLKRNLSVFRESNALSFEVEQGTLATRFFFKAGGFERDKENQILKVVIAPDLSCLDCGKPLGDKFEKTITLPAKPKLYVTDIKLHHTPGNSLISILFTLPVSSTQVRNNVVIEPAVPFKVDTEYCYAVLKAEFEPNTDYTVHVKEGLKAISGEPLEKKFDRTLRLEDIQPYVRFADGGRLIPEEGGKIVAVKTMNLDDYNVNVEKVFRNNIVDFLKNWRSYPNYFYRHRTINRRAYRRSHVYAEQSNEGDDENYSNNYSSDSGSTAGLGVHIWGGNVTVSGGQINQETESSLDFNKWHQAPYKGLFVVTLNGSNGGGQDSRSFLCTDLGMILKRSGEDILVQALSISKLTPKAGVHLQMLSDTNQVIQEKDTDTEGRAWFRNWKNNPYNFNPFVIVGESGADWSYLRMDQAPINQSRFDVAGDPFVSSGWDGYLTSDRGLYRPGDKANFTAVVRHANMGIPEDLPVNLTVRDASGNQVAKLVSNLRGFGMTTFELPIKADIPTGILQVELGLENGVHIASTTIKVEEFIPNKIKVEVKASKKTADPGEQLSFQVTARQLFGAPGVNLKVRASVQLSPLEFTHRDWKSFRFSDSTRSFAGDRLKVPDGTTDAAGTYSVQLPVPIALLPPSMIQAEVYAEVLDTGGRPVGANAVIKVHRYPYYLGLKCLEGKETAPQTPVHIKYVAISSDGKTTQVKKVQILVKRKVWYSIFRKSGWSSRGYESSFYEQVIESKEIDINEKGSFTFTPDKPGEYTVYLGNEETMRSSLMVAVSGPEENEEKTSTNMEDPEKLSLTLNQTQYEVGDIPKLEVRAPFAGRLVLTVEREQVFSTMTLSVAAGLNVVSLPVVETAFLPNVYVVGVLVRKPDESLRKMPMVSFGIAPLNLNTSGHEIAFKWEAPESVKSRQGIDVSLNTGTPGTKVVLAAVDEGILDIISFVTPDPFKHFYRKRGLTTSTLSLFDDVLPDLDRKDAVGGDEGEGFVSRHLNPIAAKRVKSFALFSGILTADKNGLVTYHFPTDKFHGEVRVMALGVENNKFGASAYHVKVADPVVVEPSFPRFLAPGDHFDVPVLIFNNTKNKKAIQVAFSTEGPVAVDGEAKQELNLEPEGQKQILFHAKASMHAGKANFKVTATDASDASFEVETELAVRPGNPLSTEIKFGALSAKGTQTLSVPGGFIPEGQRIRLAVSSSPLLTFLGSLDYLIAYPYGCAEQKTSEAFPLLYFKDMGLLTGRFSDRANAVEMFVQDAIDDLSKMQLPDGMFALWPGETEGTEYLSNYVAHFLLEAQKQGYTVNAEVMNRILERLGAIQVKQKGGRLDRRKNNVEVPESAYVLYLKALAGRSDLESMAAFKANVKDRSVTDKCFLSLAYSTLGDRTTALSILPPKFLASSIQRVLDGDWYSPNRERALYLLALAEANPQSPEIPNLLVEFGRYLKNGTFGTTQEDAWCFLALGRAVKVSTAAYPLTAQWNLKGGMPTALSGETAVVKGEKLSGKEVELKNTGDQEIYYHLMAEGTKLKSGKESVSNGLTVSREYRDEKGNTINLGSVSQGQLVVVTLRINTSKALDNLVVVDLLPAGFEVDNPRLSSRGNLQFDPECSFDPAYRDFRDDRVLLFSKYVNGDLSFSYSVRAVTPGSFQVPGLTAEAMYDPEIFGRSNTGETLNIAPAKY